MIGRARARARGRARGQETSAQPPGPLPTAQPTPQMPGPRQTVTHAESELVGRGRQRGPPGGVTPEELQVSKISAGFQEMTLGERGGRRRDFHDTGLNTRQSMEHVRESKTGTSGSVIKLTTNFFRLTSRPQWTLYQYHVEYNPVMESRRLRTALLLYHEELLGRTNAFDGAILFLPKRLEKKVTEVVSQTRSGQTVRITITLTNELPPTSPVCLQFYNIMFRRNLRLRFFVLEFEFCFCETKVCICASDDTNTGFAFSSSLGAHSISGDKQNNYLDVNLIKDSNTNSFQSCVYRKSTFSNDYLEFTSSHPLFVKRNIVKDQMVRVVKMCSNFRLVEIETQRLLDMFTARGYPIEFVPQIRDQVTSKWGSRFKPLLGAAEVTVDQVQVGGKDFSQAMVLTHGETSARVKNIIKINCTMFKGNKDLLTVIRSEPFFTYEINSNLKHLLENPHLINKRNMKGTTKCGACDSCRYINDTPKIMIWPGFVTSILQYETSILLCTDVSHKVLRNETALDFMHNLHQQTGDERFREACMKELVGLIVLTRYNNKTYRIDDIAWNLSPRSKFKKTDGSEISFVEYYKMQYNEEITEVNQPLLVSQVRSRRGPGGETQRPVNLVPEFCFLTGLTERMRNDFSVMRDMSVHTRLSPEQREQRIGRFIDYLQRDDNVQKQLRDWGLGFDSKLLSLSGRVVQPEKIHQAGQVFEYNPQVAEWSRETRGAALISVKPLDKWIMIYTRRNSDAANALIQNLFKVVPSMGVRINRAVM
ncbi:piwi-like protein 1 [Protopterus annectens]|uniref:piwi-like protein 1 n=1 Tax=Protopterus annectens TaxID=7888 RepID=UPI001CFA1EB5|nr:piwi-like protein 1 [Protopterus annectens]